MLKALYIFLGFLLFDCFVASCIYFKKERPFKQHEYQPNYISKVELGHLLRLLAENQKKCCP